ncbi:MAG: hypothetical protein ACSHXD_03800 [Marinosulfonomonas sp.]
MRNILSTFHVPKLGKGETSVLFLSISCVLALVVLAVVFGRGISHAGAFVNDSFVFFDGIDRIAAGQVPNKDFLSPVGPLPYLLPYYGYLAVGSYAGAVEMASLFLLVPVLVCASVFLYKTTSPAAALLVVGTVAGVIVVPLIPGENADQVSHAMQYNRWGWGLLLTIFLLGLPPYQGGGWAALVASLGGALLVALFLTKITYFIFAVGYLGLLVVFPDPRRGIGIFSLLMGAVLLGMVTLLQSEMVFGYIGSIQEALKSDGPQRDSYFVVAFGSRTTLIFLILAAYCVTLQRFAWREIALAGFIAVSGVMIIDQNYQWKFIVTIPAAFLILASIGDRRSEAGQNSASVAIAAGFLALLPFYTDWAQVTLKYIMPAPASAAYFDAPELAKMYIEDHGEFNRGGEIFHEGPVDVLSLLQGEVEILGLSQSEYADSLSDGARLLHSAGATDSEVFTLDFTNALALLVDSPRVMKGYSWLHFGRNVSEETLPPASEFFDGAGYVMVPLSTLTGKSLRTLIAVFGEYLIEHTSEVAQSKYWVLLKFNDQN